MAAAMEPDELYNIGFRPPETENVKRLPSWYHGMISRHDAESLLRRHSDPVVHGLFLVRKSSKDKGFVLSVVQVGEMAHYQIRHEVLDRRDYLTFDTETDRGPLFRSLSGVLHYLLNKPNLLPIPLTEWVPCLTSPALPHLGTESIAFKGDISQTLTDALSDTLAEVTGGDDVYEEPAIYAMNNPSALAGQHRFLVLWNTLVGCPLNANDVITMKKTEVDPRSGSKIIVVVDGKGRTHRLPDDCKDIEVVPYKMSTNSIRREREKSRKVHGGPERRVPEDKGVPAAPPPALPRRPTALQATGAKPARGYHHFKPAMSGPAGASRQMSDEIPADGYYYREVIKEGWLQKLPPLGNVSVKWKMRWFKLCVVISSSESFGPVVLEYYDKATAVKPKGEINLGNVTRICPVDPEDCRAKILKKTDPDLLFMIQLPERTYPLQGGAAAEVEDWVKALNETLGLEPSGKRIEPDRPKTRAESVRFSGKLVLCGQDGRSGFPCIVDVGTETFTVEGTKGDPDQKMTWSFVDLLRFGYVKQLMWVDAAITCDHPGIFCITTPDAEAIHAAVEDRVKLISDPATLVRNRSLRSNMSWTLKAMLDGATAAQPPVNAAHVTVLGKSIPEADLGYGGVTIVTSPYTAKKKGELSLSVGDSHDVLQTRAFLADGFWVTSLWAKPSGRRGSVGSRKYGLVKASCVQHHEHGFSDLAEDGDDDLLDGVDPSMYEKPGGMYEKPGGVYQEPGYQEPAGGDASYEVPVTTESSYERPVPVNGAKGAAAPAVDYATSTPMSAMKKSTSHSKFDYENAAAVKEHERKKGLKPKRDVDVDAHYVNREVVKSQKSEKRKP